MGTPMDRLEKSFRAGYPATPYTKSELVAMFHEASDGRYVPWDGKRYFEYGWAVDVIEAKGEIR